MAYPSNCKQWTFVSLLLFRKTRKNEVCLLRARICSTFTNAITSKTIIFGMVNNNAYNRWTNIKPKKSIATTTIRSTCKTNAQMCVIFLSKVQSNWEKWCETKREALRSSQEQSSWKCTRNCVHEVALSRFVRVANEFHTHRTVILFIKDK